MKKYELKKNSINVRYKDKDSIKAGCTANTIDSDPELIKAYDDKEEALKALAEYETEINRLQDPVGAYFEVTEYYVEENEYDENGEWKSGGDIWNFSEMPEYDFD